MLKALMAFLEPFRFIKRYRERVAAAAAAERAHQLAIVDRLAGMIESLSDSQSRQLTDVSTALVEIAKSNQAQAEGFSTWLKSFQIATSAPSTSVIREEDEVRAEQARFLEELGIPADAEIPAELKLAFDLRAIRESDPL
jgi:hypothetical protein